MTAHNIFGSDALYARLCLATEVLGKLVSCAPNAVGIDELTAATRGTSGEVRKLCRALCNDGLLMRAPGRRRVVSSTSRVRISRRSRTATQDGDA